MKEKLLYVFLFFSLYGFSQWSVPTTMEQFCAGVSSLVFPNVGNGFNDFWQIKYAFVEPNMQLFIFDRFGKLVHFFKGKDRGWDGTYNGKKLPSTDYWFIIKRESGQEIRGHFSMIR